MRECSILPDEFSRLTESSYRLFFVGSWIDDKGNYLIKASSVIGHPAAPRRANNTTDLSYWCGPNRVGGGPAGAASRVARLLASPRPTTIVLVRWGRLKASSRRHSDMLSAFRRRAPDAKTYFKESGIGGLKMNMARAEVAAN